MANVENPYQIDLEKNLVVTSGLNLPPALYAAQYDTSINVGTYDNFIYGAIENPSSIVGTLDTFGTIYDNTYLTDITSIDDEGNNSSDGNIADNLETFRIGVLIINKDNVSIPYLLLPAYKYGYLSMGGAEINTINNNAQLNDYFSQWVNEDVSISVKYFQINQAPDYIDFNTINYANRYKYIDSVLEGIGGWLLPASFTMSNNPSYRLYYSDTDKEWKGSACYDFIIYIGNRAKFKIELKAKDNVNFSTSYFYIFFTSQDNLVDWITSEFSNYVSDTDPTLVVFTNEKEIDLGKAYLHIKGQNLNDIEYISISDI